MAFSQSSLSHAADLSARMASLLIVEDSPDAADLIARALEGNRLQIVATLGEAREQLDLWPNRFDMVLLDLDLPDGDGLSLASELSNGERREVPFIVLSGRSDIRHKLVAFSLGAADYIEKPFHPLELQARVAARLRAPRVCESPISQTTIGKLRVETENMRAFFFDNDEEKELSLSPTEHRILESLLEVPGRIRTRESLIAEIWRDAIVGHRTIDSHVSNLRKKLEGTGAPIESVRGIGYRMGKVDTLPSPVRS